MSAWLERTSTHSRAAGFALAIGLLSAGFGSGGCAEIIGLEQREGSAGVRDTETETLTSEQCIDYCDVVMDACVDENAVYETRQGCIDVCNHLEPGEESEESTEGQDTVACRADQAKFAGNGAPDEFCPSAGPSGGESCGGACPAYCELLRGACVSDFETLASCEETCENIPDGRTFNINDFQQGDTVQCRLIQLTAAFQDEARCSRATFVADEVCVEAEAAELSCEAYCRNVMGACTDENAQYESEDQCLALCDIFEEGVLGDSKGNTLACRTYHAEAALSGPDTHCPHAGPTGASVCHDAETPGACPIYCELEARHCNTDDPLSECIEECATQFEDEGGASGRGYAVATAEDNDDLLCRFLQLSRAAEGDASACQQVDGDVSCP